MNNFNRKTTSKDIQEHIEAIIKAGYKPILTARVNANDWCIPRQYCEIEEGCDELTINFNIHPEAVTRLHVLPDYIEFMCGFEGYMTYIKVMNSDILGICPSLELDDE